MNCLEVKSMDVRIELNNRITAIMGPTNAGKTTLLKKICNIIPDGKVYLDDIAIQEYDITFLKNNIVVCLNDDIYNTDYVAEELYYYLNKLGYRIDEITKKIENIAKIFKISDILPERIASLRLREKILVKILALLIIKPKVIAIDNLLLYLSHKDVTTLLKYLKDNDISLICVTSDPEFLLLSDDVIIMNNFKAVYKSEIASLLMGNSILPYMGIKLPFIVELSQNLMLYDVLDKVYLDSRKLVDKLWK